MPNNTNTSEYREHPIFLHLINQELHDAIDRKLDEKTILATVRVFSVLSGQILFCNVSQIHEVFYQNPEALHEFTELSKIGRFIAHSDYGSFEEFRESRAEQFRHTLSRHPGFHEAPSLELRSLPHHSMGSSISTTRHIEENLRLWLDSNKKSVLFCTLSENDARTLNSNANWLNKTLTDRDQKALTFDVFERTATQRITSAAEGSIRRALTDIYIDSYTTSFQARCVWGFQGMNHFEHFKLLAGLNFSFASAIMNLTGVSENLKKTEHFGLKKRIASEGSEEITIFRQAYAELAATIDRKTDQVDAWHQKDAYIRSALQQIIHKGMLKPYRTSTSLKEIFMHASEMMFETANKLYKSEYNRNTKIKKSIIITDKYELKKYKEEDTLNSDRTKNRKTFKKFQFYNLFSMFSLIITSIITFIILGEIQYINSNIRLYATATVIVGVALLLTWFHPEFFYRRLAVVGLSMSIVGSIQYKLDFQGETIIGSGNLEIGSSSSIWVVIGGIIVFSVSIFADLFSRCRRN